MLIQEMLFFHQQHFRTCVSAFFLIFLYADFIMPVHNMYFYPLVWKTREVEGTAKL